MQPKAWYLGPLGDLRPLHCPEPGVKRPVKRYGSVHQAISGARTVDITGYRASYELTIPWLNPREAKFLQALHERTYPGPFYLLDPVETNRLGRKAAYLDPTAVSASAGGLLRDLDDPPDVGVPITVLEWSGAGAGQTLTLHRVPVLPEEEFTTSIYAAAEGASTLDLTVTTTDRAGATVQTFTATTTLTPEWQRLTLPVSAPVGAVAATPSLTTSGGAIVRLSAAQVEHGGTASEWFTGGAGPTVILDQIERVSPSYPNNDLTVTLLEA